MGGPSNIFCSFFRSKYFELQSIRGMSADRMKFFGCWSGGMCIEDSCYRNSWHTKVCRKEGDYGKNSIYVSGAGSPVCGDGKGFL